MESNVELSKRRPCGGDIKPRLFEECARAEGWGVGGQERQQCEIVWALRDPEEQKVDFEETWAIPNEAFVSWNEVGEVAAGVEEAFASGYTIVDRA